MFIELFALGILLFIMLLLLFELRHDLLLRVNLFRSKHLSNKLEPTKRLLKFAIAFDKAHESLIGDLLEEYYQFPSKLKAHLWLYKQILKSAWPLISKNIKSRFAARFRDRIR
jgi:hypothetical protein